MKYIENLITKYDLLKKNQLYLKRNVEINQLTVTDFNDLDSNTINSIDEQKVFLKNIYEFIKKFRDDFPTVRFCTNLSSSSSLYLKISKILSNNFYELENYDYIKEVYHVNSNNDKYKIKELLLLISVKNKDKSQKYKDDLFNYIKTKYREILFDNFLSYEDYSVDSHLLKYVKDFNILDEDIENKLSQLNANHIKNYYNYYISLKKERNHKLEQDFLNFDLKDLKIALKDFVPYVIEVIKKPFEEFEKKILDNFDELTKDSIFYYDILPYSKLKNGWKELEDKTIKNIKIDYYVPRHMYHAYNQPIIYYLVSLKQQNKKIFSSDFLKKIDDRFFECNNVVDVIKYAINFRKKRWIEKESFIFNINSYYNYNYQGEIIYDKKQFDQLFSYIKKFKIKTKLSNDFIDEFKKDPKIGYKYALAIKEPVPELEKSFAKRYGVAFRYARDVLKSRFPLAEKKILKSNKGNEYRKLFNLDV
jgi:hypothetical protein